MIQAPGNTSLRADWATLLKYLCTSSLLYFSIKVSVTNLSSCHFPWMEVLILDPCSNHFHLSWRTWHQINNSLRSPQNCISSLKRLKPDLPKYTLHFYQSFCHEPFIESLSLDWGVNSGSMLKLPSSVNIEDTASTVFDLLRIVFRL